MFVRWQILKLYLNLCLVLLFAVDTVRPEIQFCPQNINQQIQFGVPSVIVTWNQPTASDNSGQTPNVQATHQPGSSFPVGTSTVIYTFTDAAGNEATCSFNVNVVSGKKTYTVDFIYSQIKYAANIWFHISLMDFIY